MSFDRTVTEHDLDDAPIVMSPGQGRDSREVEPDLDVDGLSNSVFSRLFRLFDRTDR